MKNNTTKVLSLLQLARIQKDIEDRELQDQDFEDEVHNLQIEVRRRAAAEKVTPKEIWIHIPLYRQKLYSTDDRKPKVVTPLSDIVDGVIEDIRKRGKRSENRTPDGGQRRVEPE